MKQFCQWVILLTLVVALFYGLYTDFHGGRAGKPFGFSGAVITIVFTFVLFLLYWQAGAFTTIFPF
jgi:hypothetical protein